MMFYEAVRGEDLWNTVNITWKDQTFSKNNKTEFLKKA